MSFTENTASPVHVMKTEKNSPTMIHRNLTAELAVVGGGLAGVCAAIAAARHGVKTVLIQDRPVLGGNASSEIRMGIVGAHGDENKETGILEELQLENIRRNPLMRYTRWDDILYSAVIREPNLKLLLNTSVRKTETNGKRIVAVEAWNGNEYCEYRISADFFADCSGDGILRLSGAEFRIGRELPGEFDEDYLKEGGDARTMGNSILLQLRKTEEDRPFLAPEWAYHFTDADFADGEGSAPGHHSYKHPWPEDNNFWWIEFGGNLDTIGDANAIQFELKRIAYGVWEYMKNHPDGRCRNYELDWIGSLPGKRESCRFVGDHILTQHDIMAGGRFDDVVCYGGWTLDDHHPDAFFHRGYVSTHHTPPSPFGIPFRCLYSRNIENLLFAGRNISCTHMGMSATRVMGTCALMGQVIGTAAGILKRCGITPRLLYQQHIGELQELLLEDDVMLPGHRRKIPALTLEAVASHEILRAGIDRGKEAAQLAVGQPCEYRWKTPRIISSLRIVFDTDLAERNKRMLKLEAESVWKEMPQMMPEKFRVEAEIDGNWQTLLLEEENLLRLYRKTFPPCRATAVRLIVEQTYGGRDARIFSFEVG